MQQQKKFYHKNFEGIVYPFDDKKKEFIACRMERDLFLKLSEKAKAEGTDLSSVIRGFCREGLQNNGGVSDVKI